MFILCLHNTAPAAEPSTFGSALTSQISWAHNIIPRSAGHALSQPCLSWKVCKIATGLSNLRMFAEPPFIWNLGRAPTSSLPWETPNYWLSVKVVKLFKRSLVVDFMFSLWTSLYGQMHRPCKLLVIFPSRKTEATEIIFEHFIKGACGNVTSFADCISN